MDNLASRTIGGTYHVVLQTTSHSDAPTLCFASNLHFTAAATAAGLSPANEFYGPISGETARRRRSAQERESEGQHPRPKRTSARCVQTPYENADPTYELFTCEGERYIYETGQNPLYVSNAM